MPQVQHPTGKMPVPQTCANLNGPPWTSSSATRRFWAGTVSGRSLGAITSSSCSLFMKAVCRRLPISAATGSRRPVPTSPSANAGAPDYSPPRASAAAPTARCSSASRNPRHLLGRERPPLDSRRRECPRQHGRFRRRRGAVPHSRRQPGRHDQRQSHLMRRHHNGSYSRRESGNLFHGAITQSAL